jgi:hypothetical protein
MFSHEKPSAEQGIEPRTSHTVVFRAIGCATSTSTNRLATPSKVNKFFDLSQYSMKIVKILGDDVTVEVSYLEHKGLM